MPMPLTQLLWMIAGQGKAFLYDAFISYDHDDRPVAYGIQRGLHRIGRPRGRLRALRAFAIDGLDRQPRSVGQGLRSLGPVALHDRGAVAARGDLKVGQQGGRLHRLGHEPSCQFGS